MSQMVAEVKKKAKASRTSAGGGLWQKCDKCREKERSLHRSAISPAQDTALAIARDELRSPRAPDVAPLSRELRFHQDFSQIPVHPGSLPGIQTKLTVNAPGDIFEQEADRIAEEVMRMPPGAQSGMRPNPVAVNEAGAAGSVQRQAESPDKQGDCSGWERDCESFCRRAAKKYWIDIGVSPPPIAEGPVECDTPFIGPDGKLRAGMCHLKYKNGVMVTVARSIHGGRNIEVWQTRKNDKANRNEYSGPICDYRYYCTKKQNDLVLEKKFCYDPRTEERPKETGQESSPPSMIQRSSTHESSVPQAPPMVHDVLKSPGLALDSVTIGFMEDRFGHDFSDVRVHTDARAAQSARSINARAYTFGSHIVFGEGQFDSAGLQGQRLLAHELTHVVQQAGNPVTRTDELQTHRQKRTSTALDASQFQYKYAPGQGLMAGQDAVLSRRLPVPMLSPPQTIQRVCRGKATGNAILSDKEADYKKAVRSGRYCKDTGSTGLFHEGTCYREVPPKSGFPSGDQVCFDKATGKCAEDSPDVVSAVWSQNADGSCNLGFARSIGHFAEDIFPSEPVLSGAGYGLLSMAALGYAANLGESRLLGAGTGALLGIGMGAAIGKGSGPLARWLKRRGHVPFVGTSLGVAIPIPRLVESTLQARLYIGTAKRDRAILQIFYPELRLGMGLIGETSSTGPTALSTGPSAIMSLLAGIRIDPGKPGGDYVSFFGGPSLAVSSGDRGIGAEAGMAFGWRWRWIGLSANVGYIYDPTREGGGEMFTLGAGVELGPTKP